MPSIPQSHDASALLAAQRAAKQQEKERRRAAEQAAILNAAQLATENQRLSSAMEQMRGM